MAAIGYLTLPIAAFALWCDKCFNRLENHNNQITNNGNGSIDDWFAQL